MSTRIIAGMALSTATAFGLLCSIGMHAAWPASTPPSQDCLNAVKDAKVDGAAKVGGSGEPSTVSLGDKISVKVFGLAPDFQKACTATPIVLYLNSYPMKSLTGIAAPAPAAAGAPSANELSFVLRVTDGSRASWVPILGSPSIAARDITVSVGLEDQYPLPPAGKTLPQFKLDIMGNGWFCGWAILFVILLLIFLGCAYWTNVIRDGDPTDPAAHARGTFSLSKSQGAWWFFIILAAYLLIGLVTGDFFTSFNSTALILLGIGAGTVIGSAIIDHATQPQDAAKAAIEVADAKDKLAKAEAAAAAKKAELDAAPPPADAARLRQEFLKLTTDKEVALSQYRKLTRQSEWFLPDILSDANGVNFHRFQMAAWTIVLGIIFAKGVFENLAMPEFNTTLMGLLGLSAGTYLGLKIPEAAAPQK